MFQEYNANQINNTLSLSEGMTVKDGKIIYCIDPFVSGFNIICNKKNVIDLFIQGYDLRKDKYGRRLELLRIKDNMIDKEYGLIIDFDKTHEYKKNIHLNFDCSLKGDSFIIDKLQDLDHYPVVFEDENAGDSKLRIIDVESTIINILKRLKELGLFSLCEIKVIPMCPTNDKFISEINRLLKISSDRL